MNRPFFPEHHDFYSSADIRREERHNKILLEACYLGRISELRANVISKFNEFTNICEDNTSWATYEFEPGYDNDIGITTKKYVCVIIKPNTQNCNEPLFEPEIRILQQEIFLNVNYDTEVSWLSKDISIDSENDCIEYIGIGTEELLRTDSTFAPVFVIEDQKIKISKNFNGTVPNTSPITYRGVTSIPFGNYNSVEDNIAALEEAFSIHAGIQSKVPTFNSK